MTLHKNRIPLSSKQLSDPDEFNFNMRLLRGDVNSSLAKTISLEDKFDSYIKIYSDDLIENLRYKVLRLKNKVDALEKLSLTNEYSNVIHYDFLSSSEMSKETSLYIDPKDTRLTYGATARLTMANSSLMARESLNTLISPISVSISSDSAFDYSGMEGFYNTFVVKRDPSPVTVSIVIDLGSVEKDSNLIYLDHASEFPFDITKLEYYSTGVWTEIFNVGVNGVYSSVYLDFPKVTASQFRITFRLNDCKVTNRNPNNDLTSIATNLTRDFSQFLDMENFNPSTIGLYNYFVFNLGFRDTAVKLSTRSGSGAFVSNSATFVEPANLHIEDISEMNNTAVEYYFIKKDYDIDNHLFDETVIPILPKGVLSVVNESLVLVSPEILGAPSSITIATVDYTVVKAAKINFYPDASVVVKENGSILSNSPVTFTVQNNHILFLIPGLPAVGQTVADFIAAYAGWMHSTGMFYTSDYAPFHSTRDFLTPVSDPSAVTNMSWFYQYKPEYDVLINISGTENNWIVTEVNSGGTPYIKILLPYAIDSASLSLDRYIDSLIDNNAPVYYLSGPNQNVFIEGRVIYIPSDISLYPKLANSNYNITGYTTDAGLTDTTVYYYSKDNSLSINWKALTTLYGNDYAKTEIYLFIISRPTNSTDTFLKIKDVYLYSNTFGDLTITTTNGNPGIKIKPQV